MIQQAEDMFSLKATSRQRWESVESCQWLSYRLCGGCQMVFENGVVVSLGARGTVLVDCGAFERFEGCLARIRLARTCYAWPMRRQERVERANRLGFCARLENPSSKLLNWIIKSQIPLWIFKIESCSSGKSSDLSLLWENAHAKPSRSQVISSAELLPLARKVSCIKS